MDNSTLLETGEFLRGIRKFEKNDFEALERRVENSLILLHALLIGDKVKHSALKVERKNEGVKYLLEDAPTKNIIEPLVWAWKDENELLEQVRKKISQEITNGTLGPIMEDVSRKINLVSLVNDEINTYLLPEGLNHYWKNIGFDDGEKEEALNLYESFKELFSFTKIKQNNENSIDDEIIAFIHQKVNDTNEAKMLSEWYWLSFLSNVIRAEYYINLARIHKAVYSPLATRRILIEALIKDDPKENVYIFKNDERSEALFLAFIYVLDRSNWERSAFIDTVLKLKNEDGNPLKDLSRLLITISELDRSNGADANQKINEVKEELRTLENTFLSQMNYAELVDKKDSRLYNRLPNDFFDKWL